MTSTRYHDLQQLDSKHLVVPSIVIKEMQDQMVCILDKKSEYAQKKTHTHTQRAKEQYKVFAF